jgi:hypothetical protein
MASELKTMRGVYVHYWFNGASTMIFASETNADPTGQYRSSANPSPALINEVLDKIKAHNISGTPIRLRIEDDTFIVPENVPHGAGLEAGAVAVLAVGSAESAEADELDVNEESDTPPPPKPKPAAKKAAARTPGKKAAGKNPTTKPTSSKRR